MRKFRLFFSFSASFPFFSFISGSPPQGISTSLCVIFISLLGCLYSLTQSFQVYYFSNYIFTTHYLQLIFASYFPTPSLVFLGIFISMFQILVFSVPWVLCCLIPGIHGLSPRMFILRTPENVYCELTVLHRRLSAQFCYYDISRLK